MALPSINTMMYSKFLVLDLSCMTEVIFLSVFIYLFVYLVGYLALWFWEPRFLPMLGKLREHGGNPSTWEAETWRLSLRLPYVPYISSTKLANVTWGGLYTRLPLHWLIFFCDFYGLAFLFEFLQKLTNLYNYLNTTKFYNIIWLQATLRESSK